MDKVMNTSTMKRCESDIEKYGLDTVIDFDKVKSIIGDDNYKSLVNDVISNVLKGCYIDNNIADFLQHEKLLIPKRERTINNLLEDKDK